MAEEVEDFQPIDKLQQLGINAGKASGTLTVSDLLKLVTLRPASCLTGDIKKAKEGGVHTCECFLMRTKKVTRAGF